MHPLEQHPAAPGSAGEDVRVDGREAGGCLSRWRSQKQDSVCYAFISPDFMLINGFCFEEWTALTRCIFIRYIIGKGKQDISI